MVNSNSAGPAASANSGTGSGITAQPSPPVKKLSWWASLPPKKKHSLSIMFIVMAIVGLGLASSFFKSTGHKPVARVNPAEQPRNISLDPTYLKKNELVDKELELDKKNKELTDNQKKIDALESQLDNLSKAKTDSYPPGVPPSYQERSGFTDGNVSPTLTENTIDPNMKMMGMPRNIKGFPPIPEQMDERTGENPSQYGHEAEAATQGAVQATVMGDIAVFSNSSAAKDAKADNNKKKAVNKIYLPPSFMAATLLSGLDAPTSGEGKGSPIPVIIRVQDVAVLPNAVKAQLKGCFIIAEGTGSLSDERGHLRLVSLSCLAKDGKAVVDQKVKGFVVDSDGKIGLGGKVVQKMGSLIARSLIAGILQGLGTGMQQATSSVQLSPAGSLTQINPSQVGTYALGAGIATSAGEVSKFYLTMAQSLFPVIEIPGDKAITVVISEGVDLEIKNMCNRSNVLGGTKCDDDAS